MIAPVIVYYVTLVYWSSAQKEYREYMSVLMSIYVFCVLYEVSVLVGWVTSPSLLVLHSTHENTSLKTKPFSLSHKSTLTGGFNKMGKLLQNAVSNKHTNKKINKHK